MTNLDLFSHLVAEPRYQLGARAFVLRGFALPRVGDLLEGLACIEAEAPFRHMVTPGGFTMSVGLTNSGALGWSSDSSGYRYTELDPVSGRPWPALPVSFRELARDAARAAGFDAFEPDACLVNQYLPGARMSLHQDKNERDFSEPIVSVSLGLPATFLFGGLDRRDRTQRVGLEHGDVVVWGGEDRLRYHGIAPLKAGRHPLLGARRINLTFRRAG